MGRLHGRQVERKLRRSRNRAKRRREARWEKRTRRKRECATVSLPAPPTSILVGHQGGRKFSRPAKSATLIKAGTIKLQNFWHTNIESIKRPGRLQHICVAMTQNQIMVAGVSEARLKGSVCYETGGFLVLESGTRTSERDTAAGVVFIVHPLCVKVIIHFTVLSGRIAELALRTRGGRVTILLAYVPYELREIWMIKQ